MVQGEYDPPADWSETEIELEEYDPPGDWSETEIQLQPVSTVTVVDIPVEDVALQDNNFNTTTGVTLSPDLLSEFCIFTLGISQVINPATETVDLITNTNVGVSEIASIQSDTLTLSQPDSELSTLVSGVQDSLILSDIPFSISTGRIIEMPVEQLNIQDNDVGTSKEIPIDIDILNLDDIDAGLTQSFTVPTNSVDIIDNDITLVNPVDVASDGVSLSDQAFKSTQRVGMPTDLLSEFCIFTLDVIQSSNPPSVKLDLISNDNFTASYVANAQSEKLIVTETIPTFRILVELITDVENILDIYPTTIQTLDILVDDLSTTDPTISSTVGTSVPKDTVLLTDTFADIANLVGIPADTQVLGGNFSVSEVAKIGGDALEITGPTFDSTVSIADVSDIIVITDNDVGPDRIVTAVIGDVFPNSNIQSINQTTTAQTSSGPVTLQFEVELQQNDKVLNSAQYDELIDNNKIKAIITSTSPDLNLTNIAQISNQNHKDVDVVTFEVDKDIDIINSSQV